MPQIFQVLRCYKCMVFQVHQTKKLNKWECKVCGEKQSVKRHYGIGTAKDCRLHVQKLNGIRGEIIERSSSNDDEEIEKEDVATSNANNFQTVVNSKWSNYVEKETMEENTNANMVLDDAEVVSEIPKKRRKYGNNFKRNPKFIDHDVQEVCKKENLSPKNSSFSEILFNETHSDSLLLKEDLPNTNKNVSKNKFVPPVLNKSSKWAQFSEDMNESEEIEREPVISKTPKWTQFSTEINETKEIKTNPVIKKGSKWAQFTEDIKETEQLITTPDLNKHSKCPQFSVETDVTHKQPELDPSQKKSLFSLCDDSNLDDVLDL